MDHVVTALRAIGESTRLRMVRLLAQGELTVSELVQVLGQSQPRVSRHLKLLLEAGLIERLPEGTWVFYRLAEEAIGSSLVHTAIDSIPLDDAKCVRDSERLAEIKVARARAATSYFRTVAQDWDRIRALHTGDTEVEAAMVAAVGDLKIDLLIDIGTGTGRMLEVLAPRARRAIGVDLSHEMLTIARTNLERAGVANASVRHGDLYALPLTPQCADLVVIHQVLHYLDDPGRALAEATRLIKPGGRLLLVDFARHEFEFLREHHAHRRLGFDDGEVTAWLQAAGLSLEATHELIPRKADLAKDDRVNNQQGLTVKIWTARRAVDTAPLKETAA